MNGSPFRAKYSIYILECVSLYRLPAVIRNRLYMGSANYALGLLVNFNLAFAEISGLNLPLEYWIQFLVGNNKCHVFGIAIE